jgi:tetratricopeptide (TPR) repeat protein
MGIRLGIISLPLLLLFETATDASVLEALARGDEAYARRAEGHAGLWADAGPISEAIAAFEEAVAADPKNQVARTKLLQALFFKGDYVVKDHDAKLDIFERGQILAEEGITQLIAGTKLNRRGGKDYNDLVHHLEDQPHAAGIYYWGAIHWGIWGRHRGKIAAARQGVAGKIRDYARIVNALDSDYEDGSGHRMLGRLHAEAPKIPFVTGWINRKTAISELETARSLSHDPLTLLYFIEALLDYDASRRDEAMELLRGLVAMDDGSVDLIEELRAVADAQALLGRLTN